jgi:CheY-like chemotaxis protein
MSEVEVGVGPGRDQAPVILLVEDEVLIRLSISEPLREEGYVVLEAGNASEAVALVSTGHPVDLAITDVRMPGTMDGVALTDMLKVTHPALPVIVISGDLSPDRNHGGDGFLRKPFEVSELFKLIAELMDPEWLNKRETRNAS